MSSSSPKTSFKMFEGPAVVDHLFKVHNITVVPIDSHTKLPEAEVQTQGKKWRVLTAVALDAAIRLRRTTVVIDRALILPSAPSATAFSTTTSCTLCGVAIVEKVSPGTSGSSTPSVESSDQKTVMFQPKSQTLSGGVSKPIRTSVGSTFDFDGWLDRLKISEPQEYSLWVETSGMTPHVKDLQTHIDSNGSPLLVIGKAVGESYILQPGVTNLDGDQLPSGLIKKGNVSIPKNYEHTPIRRGGMVFGSRSVNTVSVRGEWIELERPSASILLLAKDEPELETIEFVAEETPHVQQNVDLLGDDHQEQQPLSQKALSPISFASQHYRADHPPHRSNTLLNDDDDDLLTQEYAHSKSSASSFQRIERSPFSSSAYVDRPVPSNIRAPAYPQIRPRYRHSDIFGLAQDEETFNDRSMRMQAIARLVELQIMTVAEARERLDLD